jgi:predicted Zn-dependent peptidase
MVVAGNVETPQVKALAEKWFGGIPSGNKYVRDLPQEPLQTAERRMVVRKDVPLDALYKCWHMPARNEHGYYVTDLIVDILGGGTSSRLFQALVKEQKLFSNVECYHFGSLDKGLLAIEGKLVKGVKAEVAEAAIELVLDGMRQQPVEEKELQKVKNKSESLMAFEDMSLMNRANSLAYYELLGDANLMNQEMQQYNSVTTEQVKALSAALFAKENSNTLYYLSDKRI